MEKHLIKKGLVFAVILLFIGVSFQPIIAEKTISIEKESNNDNVSFEEAKEYLFQTIVDISNNPEVKQFMNEHKHILIPKNNNNYDCKNAIQKIYMQNPRLLKSILFTKPKMTYKYLETNYKKGLEIIDILGEEESLDIVESVNVTNPELFKELKIIIENDKVLSNRISVLEEMNNNLEYNLDFWDNPIICSILLITYISIIFTFLGFCTIFQYLSDKYNIKLFGLIAILLSILGVSIIIVIQLLLGMYDCIHLVPY
jgi:lipopolysaccharide export LptBFGC system permease protein LptF